MRRSWGDIPHFEVIKSRWHLAGDYQPLDTAAPPARTPTLPGLSRSGAWVGQQVMQLAAPWEGAICVLSTFPNLQLYEPIFCRGSSARNACGRREREWSPKDAVMRAARMWRRWTCGRRAGTTTSTARTCSTRWTSKRSSTSCGRCEFTSFPWNVLTGALAVLWIMKIWRDRAASFALLPQLELPDAPLVLP